MRMLVIVLMGLGFLGCKAEPVAKAAVVAPETVTLPRDAAHARYFAVDPTGASYTFQGGDEIPIPFQSAIAIHLGQKTPSSPDKRVYVVNLLGTAQDGPTVEAKLMTEDQIRERSTAGFKAYDLGSGLVETATDTAELAAPEVEEESKPRRKRNRANKRQSSGPGIEIVDLGVGGKKSRRRSRRGKKSVGLWGWKSVAIYSTPWCGSCKRAKRWMKANNVSYTNYNVDKDRSAAQRKREIASRAGKSAGGVPTIVIGNEEHVMVGWSASRFTRLAAK